MTEQHIQEFLMRLAVGAIEMTITSLIEAAHLGREEAIRRAQLLWEAQMSNFGLLSSYPFRGLTPLMERYLSEYQVGGIHSEDFALHCRTIAGMKKGVALDLSASLFAKLNGED